MIREEESLYVFAVKTVLNRMSKAAPSQKEEVLVLLGGVCQTAMSQDQKRITAKRIVQVLFPELETLAE